MGLPKPQPKTRFTFDQYLERERVAEDRHLYLDGEIFNMAGESLNHSYVSVNLVVLLGSQLHGKRCSVHTKDTKVRSSAIPSSGSATAGMFSYPDILVLCGEPEFHDAFRDIVLNPKVILEVLSESTEAFDRGEKFERYQMWNPSLSDYLLVSQDQPKITHFTRLTDGTWSYQLIRGLDAEARIESIDCALKLADVYDRVSFPKGE